MVLALGVTLLFSGVVTHPLVGFAGVALMLIASVGWWWEVLPVDKVEAVPVVPPEQRAKPIVPVPETVQHLQIGERGHRVRLPLQIHPYRSGLRGGFMGALAMVVVAETYGLIAHGSLWFPVNALSAVLVPSLSDAGLAELESFSALGLGLGIVIHFTTSVFVGLVFACLLPMLPRRPILWGGVVTPMVWTGMIWATLSMVNPTLNAHISWPWFIASQIAFGIVCGRVIARTQPIETIQSWPLAARAGVEAPGVMSEKEPEE
jgi:hypothetical protein